MFIKKPVLITGFIIGFSFNAHAAATISSVSGNMNDGQQVTISGSGFGNKSTSAPVEFLKDNIESGQSGSFFSAPGWVNTKEGSTTAEPKYTNQTAHSGKQSIHLDYYGDRYSGWSTFDSGSGGQSEWYITAWVKLKKNDNSYRGQWKSWRINSANEYSLKGNNGIRHDNWVKDNGSWQDNGNIQIVYGGGTTYPASPNIPSDSFLFDQWQRVEYYQKRASGGGKSDGIIWMRRIGRSQDIVNDSSIITHSSGDGMWRYLLLGQYWGSLKNQDNSEYTGVRDMDVYYDDVYIDNTMARVELGNASTWTNCTHREIQPPKSWSSNSIAITVNNGNFTAGEKAYLYVVDANGNVNYSGYPVTIGSSSASSSGGGGSTPPPEATPAELPTPEITVIEVKN